VYQTSTMAALLDGIYDGDVTIAELLTHGDFGLGTFNHLDGEMVVLDGSCYHLRSDGSATTASPQDKTPFAAVLWFRPDPTRNIKESAERATLTAQIDSAVSRPHRPVPVRRPVVGRHQRADQADRR
jgi:acetolactate decarboxylase